MELWHRGRVSASYYTGAHFESLLSPLSSCHTSGTDGETESESERDRQTDRQKDRQTDPDGARDRERE